VGDKTGIEWTDATWNPIAGCSVVSPGCKNCYAMKMAGRLAHMSQAHEARWGGDPGPLEHYRDTTEETRNGSVWTGLIRLAPDHLVDKPLAWTRPRRIFVNSMSDLFHPGVEKAWQDRIFDIMESTPRHTYQILTKRPELMQPYLAKRWAEKIPPLHIWLGTSVEDQARLDDRVPWLLHTPAAIRFVSAEPLLGPLDFKPRQKSDICLHCGEGPEAPHDDHPYRTRGLDWIIVGGESGPGARPMHPDWVRTIRDQCKHAGVAFFFKQWGEWHADALMFTKAGTGECPPPDMRIGKKKSGRTLDGRTHDDYPGGLL